MSLDLALNNSLYLLKKRLFASHFNPGRIFCGLFIKDTITDRGRGYCTAQSDSELQQDQVPEFSCPTPEEEDAIYKRLRKAMAKWQGMSHNMQLRQIRDRAKFSLKKFGHIMGNQTGNMSYFSDRMDKYGGYPCELLPVRASPIFNHYRNKDTYLIGRNELGEAEIGFYIQATRSTFPHIPVCGKPLLMQKKKHVDICEDFTRVVKKSGFPSLGYVYNESGGWKNLLVRSNLQGQTMVETCVSPHQASRDTLDRIRDLVYEYFIHGEGRQFGVNSLYHREQSGLNLPQKRAEGHQVHLYGDTHLVESLLGKKFQIHPDSFFQVNSLAAEVMYDTISELCRVNKDSVLLDICSGTGTIGIILADKVRKVYGIEIIQSAIDDAKVNCEMNNINNIEFICGDVTKVLPRLLKWKMADDQEHNDVIAVLNPGRAGTSKEVIRALRNSSSVKRVVYASCKPIGRALYNFVHLCSPTDDKVTGEPFVPVKAVPIEMFPHSGHFELLMLFER